MNNILVSGGAGFIGSNLINYLGNKYPSARLICLDKLTYASNPDHIQVAYILETDDINSRDRVKYILKKYKVNLIYHLAAFSHVDNSITDPDSYIYNNTNGTQALLEVCREINFKGRFIEVNTDEVFGQLQKGDKPFTEETSFKPTSPYSASKAAAALISKAYYHSYGLDIITTHCSNNYGPNQHNEKLVPKTIEAWKKDETARIYGDGTNVRDWIYVTDHCEGLDILSKKGRSGESYCIGANTEVQNIDIIKLVWETCNKVAGVNKPFKYIFTNDRPTDDRRYAIDNNKLVCKGWAPNTQLEEGLEKTVKWYLGH